MQKRALVAVFTRDPGVWTIESALEELKLSFDKFYAQNPIWNNEKYDFIIQVGLGGGELARTGLEFMDELLKRYPSVPVLVISSHSGLEETVLRAGAMMFVYRPVGLELLIKKIKKFLVQSKTAG